MRNFSNCVSFETNTLVLGPPVDFLGVAIERVFSSIPEASNASLRWVHERGIKFVKVCNESRLESGADMIEVKEDEADPVVAERL